MEILSALTNLIVLVPTILVVLNEALKRIFSMDAKFSILIDLIGGVALYVTLSSPYPVDARGWILNGLVGFLLGASAGGIYDLSKIAVETKFFTK